MKLRIIFIALAAVACSGCVSYKFPSMSDKTFPASDQCIVLGEVTWGDTITNVLGFITIGGVTYSDLLAEARRKYGAVDDVVNVSVDESREGVIGLVCNRKITMRGTAIVYTVIRFPK